MYPFADSATLSSVGRALTLDRDLFQDAALYPIGGGARLYLSRIDVATRQVTLRVGAPGAPLLAAATFDPLTAVERVALADESGRPAGLFVCDPLLLAAAQTWPEGTYTFAVGATEFVASCCIPIPGDGLRGVRVDDRVLAGDVWIVGDAGVVVRDDGPGVIRVDIVGDPLFERRICGAIGKFTTPRFVRTINGIPPDGFGDFQVAVGNHDAVDTTLRVNPDGPGRLRVSVVGPSFKG